MAASPDNHSTLVVGHGGVDALMTMLFTSTLCFNLFQNTKHINTTPLFQIQY